MVFYGAIQQLLIVWDTADLIMGLMAITNLIAITLLCKVAIDVLNDYISQLKQGKNPVFRKNSFAYLKDIECWDK